MNKINKDWVEISKLHTFYLLQLYFYGKLFLVWWNVHTFFFELVIFELGNLLLTLLYDYPKFLVDSFELFVQGSFQGKRGWNLKIELVVVLVKIAFQVYCLFRFTFHYQYPVFWARDIILSILLSIQLLTKFYTSFKLYSQVDK